MKILYVYQFCTLGGVESVLRNRLFAFHKKGIFPRVVFLNDLGGSKMFEGFGNIHYENREGELRRLIDEGEFDFVIPIDTPQIYPVLKRSHFKGILVTEVHTNNLSILRYLSEIGETETKAIVTPSQFEKELIHKEIRGFGKTGIPIYVVPNPIDPEVFHFRDPRNKSDKKLIGWVGRLEEQKNWKHFLQIVSAISEKRNDLLFLVIGGHYAEGDTKKEFLSLLKKLSLIDRLKWIPYLSYDKMPGVYSLIGASGGCLVATSIIEPFGMTVIEAMACQCPVVASRVGGFLEIIEDGKTGLLFQVNSTLEALTKVERLIDDTSGRAQLTRNGWLAVNETYSSERIVGQYLAGLKEIAALPPRTVHPIQPKTFEQGIYKHFETGKNSPTYETYVQYALSTNDRGAALVDQLSRYIRFKDKSYLDIGTAYGGYVVAFAMQGCRPYQGIEIDGKLVELCKLNLLENKFDPNCVLQLDICGSFPDILKMREFDIITCTDVLEHISDVPKALENMKSLMAHGSYLYLEIPNRYHVNNVLSDPHFGLFGITLLERDDAIEYFRYLRGGDYLVSDYHEFDYYLSFFPKAHFDIKTFSNDYLDFKGLDNSFNKEIENNFKSRIDDLPIPVEMKEKLKLKFKNYIDQYVKQMYQRDIESFYVQNWKVLIRRK